MSYPKYIDLNIGVSALTHLTIEDALKEIISNAYDEHTISKKKEILKFMSILIKIGVYAIMVEESQQVILNLIKMMKKKIIMISLDFSVMD